MSETPENKPLVAVGGNSRLARSIRAKLQWRDRFGRWIEMGRGVKFKVRGSDGAPRSVIGKYVGAIDDRTGQVYVSKDPNGLPDGFYQVKSNNAQEIIADLSPRTLNQRGIELGKDINGNEVGERMSEDIPSISQIVRSGAPEGWKLLPDTLGGRKVMETEDGDFRIAFGGQDGKWIVENRAAKGKGFAFNNPGEAFQDVEDQDTRNGDTPAAPDAPQQDDLDAQIARQQEAYNQAYVSGNEARIQAAKQVLDDLKAQKGAQPDADAPAEQNATSGAIDTDTFDVAKEGFLVPTGKKTNDTSAEGLANFITSEKEALSKGGARLVVDSDTGEAEIYNSADTLDNAKAQAGGLGTDRVIDLAKGTESQISDGAVDPNSPEVNPNLDGDTSADAPSGGAPNAEDSNPNAVEPQPANPGADAPASPEPDAEAQRTDQPAAPAAQPGADAARPAGDPGTGAESAPGNANPDAGDADRLEREAKIAEARAKIAEIDARIGEIDQELEQNRARQAELRGEAPEAPREPSTSPLDENGKRVPDEEGIVREPADVRDWTDIELEDYNADAGVRGERNSVKLNAVRDEIQRRRNENKPEAGAEADVAAPENLPEPGSLADLEARRASFQRDFEAADDINAKLGLSQEMRKLDQEISRKRLDEPQADAPEAAKNDEPSLEVPEVNVDAPEVDAPLSHNETDEPPVDAPKNKGEMVESPAIQAGDVVADWNGDPRVVLENREFNPRGDRVLRFPAEQGKQNHWIVSPVAEIERLDDTAANIVRKEFNEGPRPDEAGRYTLGERSILANGKEGDVVKRDAYPEDVQEGDYVRHPDGFDVQVNGVSQVEDDERGPGYEVGFGEDGDSFFLSRADRLTVVKGPEDKAVPNSDQDADRLFPDDGALVSPDDIASEDIPAALDAARRLRDAGEPGLDGFIGELEFIEEQQRQDEELSRASYEIFTGNVQGIEDGELAERVGNLEEAERTGFISPEMEGELRALREEANRRFGTDGVAPAPRPDLAQVQRVENGQVVFDTRDEGDQRVAPNAQVAVRDLQPGDRFYDQNGRLVEVVSVNTDPNAVGNVQILDENGNRVTRDMALDYPVRVVRGAPEAQNAPEVPQEPQAPERAADSLPDSVDELEAMAGRLERQIDGARGARQRVLQQQVDRIYDRIDELNGEAGTPDNGSDGDVGLPPANIDEIANDLDEMGLPDGLATWERELLEGWPEPEPGPELDPAVAVPAHESKVRVARAKLEGKDLNASERDEIINELLQDGLTDRELDAILDEIDNAPNRANTVTTPKPANEQPDRHSTADPEMAAQENNPNYVPDDDAIWDQIKSENPGYVFMPNGDMIIESNYNYVDKHGVDRGKDYQLVVRHTLDNRFQVYILEKDRETGNRVSLRVGVESHSYKALSKYITRGRNQVRDNKSLHVTVSRAKNGKEVLGRNRNMGDDIIQRFIDGGQHLPDENVGRNVALQGVVDRIHNGQAPDDILADLGEIAKSDKDLADALRQAFYVRSIKKAFVKRRARREPHRDYNDKLMEKGQWFDWTDWRVELDVHDPMRRRPNPNYGKVYRGQIKALMTKNAAGEYEYSDNVQVKFAPGQGLNSNKWVKRVAANLRIVEGPNAPTGEPFFAKVEEKRSPEAVADAFGVPKARDNARTTPRPPKADPPRVGEVKLIDGFVEGFENIYVPQNSDDAVQAILNGEPRSSKATDLQPGEIIIRNGANGIAHEHVLRVDPAGNGRVNILAVRRVGNHYEYTSHEVPADQRFTRWDPMKKPAPAYKGGDVVQVGDTRYIVKQVDPDGRLRLLGQGLANRDLMIDPIDVVAADPRPDGISYEARMAARADVNAADLSEIQKVRYLRMLANPDINQADLDLVKMRVDQANKGGEQKQNVGIQDIFARIAGAPAADRAANAIRNAQADENVIGIQPVKYRDINSENFMDIRPNIRDIQMGDVFQIGNKPDGALRMMQVAHVEGANGGIMVRFIGERPGDVYNDLWSKHRNGDMFEIDLSKYRDGVQVRRMRPGKLENLYQRIDAPAGESKLLERIREKSEWLKKAWNSMAEEVLFQIDEEGGVRGRRQNIGGAAADIAKIVDTPDGKKMFIKRSPVDRNVNMWPREKAMWSEVLGNRLAGALGIVGPSGGPLQGDYDKERGFFLGEVIDGEVAFDARRKNLWVKGYENEDPYDAAVANMWDISNAWRIGLFDALTQNGDRHGGNWMIGRDGNVYPIDHGNIHWGRGARAVRSPFAEKFLDDIRNRNAPITSAELLRLKNEFASMRGEFQAAGQGDWFNNVYANFEEIINKVKRNGN